MRSSHVLAAAALFAASAFAQETTAVSALTITTNDASVAGHILEMFESSADLPEMGEGKSAVLSLDDGGNLAVRQGAGNSWLRIDAHPAQLMEIFGAQVAQGQAMASMMGNMALGQQGIEAEEADAIITALFGFPKQIETLSIVIPTAYEQGTELPVDVTFEPKADTWFGKLVANLQPSAGGVDQLAGGDDAMLRMDANIDMARILPQMLPMLSIFSAMGQTTKEEKANAAKLARTSYEAMSGTMSMSFDFQNGMRMVAGLADAAKMTALLADPAYATMAKNAAEASDMAEATIEIGAITHRDVKINKSSVQYDNPEMSPFGSDEPLESYTAVAGSVLVSTMMGNAKSEIQGLIDAAMDKKLKRAPLTGNALMVGSLNMAAMMSFMEQQGAPAGAGDEMPENVGLTLAKTAKGLNLKVTLK